MDQEIDTVDMEDDMEHFKPRHGENLMKKASYRINNISLLIGFLVILVYVYLSLIGIIGTYSISLHSKGYSGLMGNIIWTLPGLISALLLGLIIGVPFGLLFPKSTFSLSLLVTLLATGCIFIVVGYFSWVNWVDSIMLILLYALFACIGAKARTRFKSCQS